jgi:hypothetical protein
MADAKDLRCRLGFHHYAKIVPLHPKNPRDYWFECKRCGKFRDSAGGTPGLGGGQGTGVDPGGIGGP